MANVPNCDCYTNDQCNPPVWSPPSGLPGDYVLMLNSVNSHNIPGRVQILEINLEDVYKSVVILSLIVNLM